MALVAFFVLVSCAYASQLPKALQILANESSSLYVPAETWLVTFPDVGEVAVQVPSDALLFNFISSFMLFSLSSNLHVSHPN